MQIIDILVFALQSVTSQRFRSSLIILAMAIGVGAVIILTALGTSARDYITREFAELGTNLIIVLPGRSETTGGQPPLLGETPRDLTLDDADALLQNRDISKIAPITIGSAPVSFGQREREANIMGSTSELRTVRHLTVAQGRFLPAMPSQRALPVCVIGHQLRQELFGNQGALGQWLRIGDRRFRVIGILGSEGQSIGVDFDEIAIIPVASAQILFDSPSLFRILAEAKSNHAVASAMKAIRKTIKARHEGEDDVTVIAQDSVIDTFDEILSILTYAVAGIAAISLAVAGVLIMNVMLVSVVQRTAEIGLLKAVGAAAGQIKILFLAEAGLLSATGALGGLALGYASAFIAERLYPEFPITVPYWASLVALGVALITGLVSGVLPAIQAGKLDPIAALAKR